MRVIYKKTMIEKIDEAINEAMAKRRDIKYIELSLLEWKELCRDLRMLNIDFNVTDTDNGIRTMVRGVEIRMKSTLCTL